MVMPDVWTPDDLQFADIRAMHHESADHVAADLLAATGKPSSRLKGITAAEASLRAAELLIAADDRDRAATVARQVLQHVRSRSERLAAACILARAGDQGPVETLAAPTVMALRDRPSPDVITDSVALAVGLADGEQFELATRTADEANAAYVRWKAGAGRRADRNGTLGNLVDLARETILIAHRDLQDLAAGRCANEPGMQPSTLSPWPALFGSCLAWWPEAEYHRIVRQVPDLRSVLGATWRDHTATVESAMRALAEPASQPRNATAYSLAASDFGNYCGYLRRTGADPRQATTMTGFTARLVGRAEIGVPGIKQPTPWPPAEGSPCWCCSNARYRDCCRSRVPDIRA
jgi:hypothetical protein